MPKEKQSKIYLGKIPRVLQLPSTTRKGTTLNTAVALDSPSILSKLVTPSHALRAITIESDTMSNEFDDAFIVLDDTSLLGPFLESQIAKSKEIEHAKIIKESPFTPNRSPDLPDLSNYKSDYPEDSYIELDDNFFREYMECNSSPDPDALKKLLEKDRKSVV